MNEFKEQMRHRIQESMSLFKSSAGLMDPLETINNANLSLEKDFTNLEKVFPEGETLNESSKVVSELRLRDDQLDSQINSLRGSLNHIESRMSILQQRTSIDLAATSFDGVNQRGDGQASLTVEKNLKRFMEDQAAHNLYLMEQSLQELPSSLYPINQNDLLAAKMDALAWTVRAAPFLMEKTI